MRQERYGEDLSRLQKARQQLTQQACASLIGLVPPHPVALPVLLKWNAWWQVRPTLVVCIQDISCKVVQGCFRLQYVGSNALPEAQHAATQVLLQSTACAGFQYQPLK